MNDNNDRIAQLLTELGVEFCREAQFPGLHGVFGGALAFDFFVPSVPLLLEYQGPQHYATRFGIQHGNTESSTRVHELKMLSQHEHDMRKRRYCLEQGLILVEIPPGLTLTTERCFLADCVAYWRSYKERLGMSREDAPSQRAHDQHVHLEQHPVLDTLSKQSAMLETLREECVTIELEHKQLKESIASLTSRVKTKKQREQMLIRALHNVDKEMRLLMTPANDAVQHLHTKLDKLAVLMEDCATVCFGMARRARKRSVKNVVCV